MPVIGIVGKPKKGKTVSACTFPKPLLLLDIMDRGSESIKNSRNADGSLVVPDWEQVTVLELYHADRTKMTFKSFASTGDAKKTSSSTPDYAKGAIPLMDKYEAVMDELFEKGTVGIGGEWDESEKKFLNPKEEKGPFKTIVIDPLTNMFRQWKCGILDINRVGDLRRGDYLALDAILANQFIPNLKSLNDRIPYIILTDHEDQDADDEGNVLAEFPVGPSKGLGKKLSEFLDNVWRMDTDVVNGKKFYVWRTKEHLKFLGAGSRWDLPDPIRPATYQELERILLERRNK
jgi:hypothetical protein